MINDYLSQVDWNALFHFCLNVDCCWKEFRYQIELAIETFVPKLTFSDYAENIKVNNPTSLIARQSPNFGEIGDEH